MKNNQETLKAIKEKINTLTKGKTKQITVLGIILIIAIIIILVTLINNTRKLNYNSAPEIARSMTYNQVQKGEEKISGTDYVTFDAFFLRDLNGDGVAEGIRGMCREVGKTDTLYIELNVLTNGYLENGQITLNGTNAYFQTTIPKDNEIAENAIGNNIKTIKLNTINNGTQKLLTAIACSGNYSYSSSKTSAIGTDTNNYSKINSLTLTGTHVAEDGTRTEIEKTVEFNIDWYGTVKAEMPTYIGGSRNLNQEQNIETAINEEAKTFTVVHNIGIQEVNNQLNIKKSYIEGEIPELNGYAPTSVTIEGTNVSFTYDEETKKFTAQKEAVVNENGVITSQAYDGTYSSARYNKFKLTIIYPLEAYQTLGTDTVESKLTVKGYYEGYNNQNTEFRNPYKSNEVQATFILTIKKPNGTVTNFDITIGKYISNPSGRYMISKEKPLKIYNGISEKEVDDTYLVRWYGYTGTNGQANTMIMKETKNGEDQVTDEFRKTNGTSKSMENVTTNVGIYFSNPANLLGEEGFIKVYDDETDELIETFTKENWNDFNSSTPYQYDIPVKHIRIETSATNASSSLTVYNIKELDDEYITQNYTREEFDNLQYIKSTLTGYLDETSITTTHTANYEVPYAVATVGISKTTISTQETEKNMKITITAQADQNANQVQWKNGAFLLKLPQDIVDVEINNVTISNNNVKITSYEKYEENGINYIKINTENEKLATYNIVVDCNITPDPRIPTKSENFELYAYNENAVSYWNQTQDIYDVNDNLNTEETINKASTSISLVSPNSLLTSQTITNYNSEGNTTIAPKIAEVSKEQRTANINIEINNNYSSTISEVQILGRVPYERNKYTINKNEMGSTFTATIQNTGIQLPEALQEVATIYYSENGEATKDLTDTNNGWTTTPTDFSKVKSYLIDLGNHSLAKGEKHTFTYTVDVPQGLSYNQVSYSHHAVYFSLDTESGKYRTQTEPNKIGLMIAKQYDLELTKYQTGKENKVSGATYLIIEEGQEEGKTKVTRNDETNNGINNGINNGKLTLNNLYIDRTYIIREIKTPSDYELNTNEIKFTTSEENGEIKITLLTEANTVKSIKAVQPQENKGYKVQIEVEDEVKARLKLIKTEMKRVKSVRNITEQDQISPEEPAETEGIETTQTFLQGVRFKITGKNFKNGITIATNNNGEVTLKGLSIGEEYTLEEVKTAEGYYLNTDRIKFTIENNNGEYTINITEGTVKTTQIIEQESIPTVSLNIENEKIPTYNVQILKVVKGEETRLQGAKFNLYKGTEKLGVYTTDENGTLTIENLYQYEAERNIDQTYTLKEVIAPEGYAAVKDITFKVENKEGLLTMNITSGTIKEQTVEGNTVTITIEDSPSFKLIKKDGETGEVLSNTKFAIYNVDDGTEQLALDAKYNILGTKETINGKEYHTLTTNEKGEIEANLREGLYKAVEVKASDDKYDITDNIYYFGIGDSREAPEVMGVTWATSVGESDTDRIYSVTATSDGGYIVGGYFESSSIQVGDYTLTSNGGQDGMFIKYSREGNVEWASSVGGSNDDKITSVTATSDGGYIVGGYFKSSSIQVGDYTLTNNGDYDGMLIKYSKEGKVEWASSVGGSGSDHINSVSATSDGGYIVGGYFSSSIQVGDYILTTNGKYDGMLIKYSREGNVEWATSVGGSNDDQINSVSAIRDGGYIVGGYFLSSSIQVGDYTLANKGQRDGVLIKYSREGEVECATSFGGNGVEEITSVSATRDGGYIVVGDFSSSSIQVGDYTLTNNNSGTTDGMLIKYSEEGTIEWVTSVGGSSHDYITSVSVTRDGGYIVGGYFESKSIQVGDYTLTSKGDSDGMLIKYSREGNVEWGTSVGGSNDDKITSVTATSDGGYIVGGYFYSASIQVGEYTLTSNGYYDGMLIKFGKKELANPITTKANAIGESGIDNIESVSATSDGGYIVGGSFESSSIQVGDYTLTNKGSYKRPSDGMLIKYSREGEVEWATSVGGSNNDYIESVSETSDGGYIVGGYFYSASIQVGDYTLTNKGNDDGMLIKYSREGEVEWATSVGGSDYDLIKSVSATSDGGYIVGGYFESKSIQVGDYTLTNKGNDDGILIKYSREGTVEWATSIGGRGNDFIGSVSETSDGGYIVGGHFGDKIQVGDYTLTNKGYFDAMIIKYSREGNVEWATSIGGRGNDFIGSVSETSDGGYIVGGDFSSRSIQIGDYTVTNKSNENYSDGMLIKYNREGTVEWLKAVGGSGDDRINSVSVTSDGGYIVGGAFSSSSIQIGDYILTDKSSSTSHSDGMVIKYSREGKVEWAKGVGGSKHDYIGSVTETTDGTIIAVGDFNSSTIETDRKTLTNKGDYDGMLLSIVNYVGVPEVQELTVENERKEFKITTDVNEIDNIKGGSISGEDKNPYETVKYGDSSTKEIIMTPEEGYEIISITVNGEEYKFTPNEDGTYTMPTFENIQENKHIVVTYALASNKITINKVDSNTKEPIPGVKFKLDQIEERTNPENVIGNLTANGTLYDEVDIENEEVINGTLIANGEEYVKVEIVEGEIADVKGELTNNGDYYFVQQEDGTYIPTNGKTYQVSNGGTAGISGVTANSYMTIDLSSKEGTYVAVVNANVSSESGYDYGYATITETTTAPAYNLETGRFMYESGIVSAKDYTSIPLEGGKTYYLHLGYRKDNSQDRNNDQVTINSINVYKATTTSYNFIEKDERYVPTNLNKANTIANSYIPIDLTGKEGKYAIIVNAETNYTGGSGYLYATLKEDTTRPTYSTSTGRFIYITSTQTAKDYVTYLEGGKQYYLHLGYTNGTGTPTNVSINSIELYKGKDVTYNFIEENGEYKSNNQGKASTTASSYIPIDLTACTGKYNLIINAKVSSQSSYDYGYATVTTTQTAPEYYSSSGRFVYISGTSTNASDYTTVLQGGQMYYLHLGYYKNASTDSGDDTFTVSNVRVTLNDSELYHVSSVTTNSEGQAITQIPYGKYALTEINAPEGYEQLKEQVIIEFRVEGNTVVENNNIANVTVNANGEFVVENVKSPKVIVHHYLKDEAGNYTTTKLAEDDILIGKLKTSEEQNKEEYTYIAKPHLDLEEYELEKDESGNYVTPENATGEYTVEEIEVTYYYETKTIPLVVNHYIQGTINPVPLANGETAKTENYSGKKGESYTTNAIAETELNEKYELVEIPENYAGTYENDIITVNYYYKVKEFNITTKVEPHEEMQEQINESGETVQVPVMVEGGTITGQNETPYETVEYGENSTKDIIATPEEGYQVSKITVNGEEIEFTPEEDGTVELEKFVEVTENKEIVVSFERIPATVVVHYYIEGTEQKVPSKTEGVVEDIQILGKVGDIYATKSSEEVVENYELSSTTENTSGIMTKEPIEVTYYYTELKAIISQSKIATTENGLGYVIAGETISYTIEVTNSGRIDKDVIIKDTIPEGTSFVEGSIKINGTTSIANEEELNNGIKVTVPAMKEEIVDIVSVSFDVTVNKNATKDILNTAMVDETPTNETKNPYKKPEPELTSKVEKTGTDKVTSKDTKVYYEVKFTATINDFVGKAKVTTVDTLPYAIDESKSNLNGGTYDSNTRTITWEDEIENIDTFNAVEAKEIALTKVLELSYQYENLDSTTGSMLNKVHSKIELQEPKIDDHTTYETVKADEKDAEKETLIEIPAEVIVHHYFYDAETNRPTTVKLAEDNNLTGIVGQNYTTTPSSNVTANYVCVNNVPEKHEGKMTENTIEVIYYYTLTTPTLTNTIEKTATANKVVEETILNEITGEETKVQYPTLTKEDGEVTYNISYKVNIENYIGKAVVEVVDTLPAKIDTEKSDLNGGEYNEATKTITWKLDIENINTYANGTYKVDLTKQIKLVYVDQNVNSDLVNTVTGSTKVYYPEEHPTKGGKEQKEETAQAEATVKQEYKVNLTVEKVWEDNNNLKGKRPESVEVTIKEMTQGEVTTQVLSAANNWKCVVENLPKYDEKAGRKLTYTVTENEVNSGDLEYYENPEITNTEVQTEETTTYKYTVKNSYKLLDTDLNTQITKEGTQEITTSAQPVDYSIHFTAEIANYIGRGKVTIVDTLPYEIDETKSNLNGGTYNKEEKTITWEQELPHINTEVSGESYQVDITKQISVVYKDLSTEIETTKINKITNSAKGKVELYETDQKDEKQTTFDTNVNVPGKVIVRYVDKTTGKDIIVKIQNEQGELVDVTYNYEITGKVGETYRTNKKDIKDYVYVESTNNEIGIFEEQDQEVIYYYENNHAQVIVKYQDKDGKLLTDDEVIEGKPDALYTTTPKEIENYKLIVIPDNKEGTMSKGTITVIYVYEKIPAKVIVKYLEKDTEKELAPEDIIQGYVSDKYETQRKAIANYRKAEPEPNNATGIMKVNEETNNTITVIYYYERIPSGNVTVKYVDEETKEEITYENEETGEEKKYGYEIKGNVGDKYNTEEKEIPYYNLTKVPSNKQGELTESGDTVVYYYRKQKFNMEITKEITKVVLNGEQKKITDGKLMKLEIPESQIATTDLEITYTIKVRNTEELAGTAKVLEMIPKGYTLANSNPEYWTRNTEGNLETTVELQPGEERVLEVVLKWNNNENNFGEAINTATLTNLENEANYEETTIEDNTSVASIITSVKTGEETKILEMVLKTIAINGALILIISMPLIAKKRKQQI